MQSLGDILFVLPFWYRLTLAVALGAILGSFIAALCSRWPRGEGVSHGRSRCEACETILAGKDLVPVLSYLLLKGRCRYCGRRIGAAALYIELIAAAIGVIAIWMLAGGAAIAAAIFGWLLLPLAILDYQKLWLPNRLILVLAVAGLLFGPTLAPDISWLDRAMGGVFGFLSLEIIRQIFKALRKVDGMGGGDPKLFAAIGIWLGWQTLPMTLLLSCLLGFVFVLAIYLRGKSHAVQLPLGSFLCIGALFLAVFPAETFAL